MKCNILAGVIACLTLLTHPLFAEVRLPKIFNSHMVLQRDKPVPLWGWADPGEKVTVLLTDNQRKIQSKTVKADKSGQWKIQLESTAAGGPYQLAINGKKNNIQLEDVLFGEVWICSGQSNMQWTVNVSANAEEEIKNGNHPQIRHFLVPREMSLTPKNDVSAGKWQSASPETVGNFTAVGYYFARKLQEELNVPVGLINTSWGGTIVETWISKESMESFNEFKEHLAAMPTSMDVIAESNKQKMIDRILKIQSDIPGTDMTATWSSGTFDYSTWPTHDLPRRIDHGSLNGLDGVVWYKRNIQVPESAVSQPVVVSLGKIKDISQIYINGVKVGEHDKDFNSERNYYIPAGTLKTGTNNITVRIENIAGNGGFLSDKEWLFVSGNQYYESLAGTWHYKFDRVYTEKINAGPNDTSTLLYNAMIAPIVPYAIGGAIWYQGESNAGRAYQYRKSFPLMISDWRKQWNDDFPFLFVQLAGFNASLGNSEKGSTWAELREAQTMTLDALPKTGMAVIAEIGEAEDIHPRNKQDVGKRLAINALHTAYKRNNVYSGPIYKSMTIQNSQIALNFDHIGSGLTVLNDASPQGYLMGFEVAGSDKKFYPAKAEIRGNQVIVWNDQVKAPVAARYGWADNNININLYNKEGLPASPFRTDNWTGITEQAKYK